MCQHGIVIMKSATELLEHMENEGLTKFTLDANTVEEVKLAKKKICLHQKNFDSSKEKLTIFKKGLELNILKKTSLLVQAVLWFYPFLGSESLLAHGELVQSPT